MSAGVLDLRFQRTAGRHQRLHTLNNRGLLGEGWEGGWDGFEFCAIEVGLPVLLNHRQATDASKSSPVP